MFEEFEELKGLNGLKELIDFCTFNYIASSEPLTHSP